MSVAGFHCASRFIAHLELKGYAATTRRNYLESVVHFSKWLKRSPERLKYLLYLKLERKLAVRNLNIHLYAPKCFCEFVLPEADFMSLYKRLKEPKHHLDILSRKEIKVIIDTEQNLKYRRYLLPPDHYRIANAIMKYQTESLGHHQYECENCHEPQTHFHSSRNRHCPRCQRYAPHAVGAVAGKRDASDQLFPYGVHCSIGAEPFCAAQQKK